jgi:hypothetical protein
VSSGAGQRLYKLVCQLNLEGIVAKRAASPYGQNANGEDWIKIKNPNYSHKGPGTSIQTSRPTVAVSSTLGSVRHLSISSAKGKATPSSSRAAKLAIRCVTFITFAAIDPTNDSSWPFLHLGLERELIP